MFIWAFFHKYPSGCSPQQENKCALLKIVHEKHDNIRNTFHPLIYFAFK